MWHLVRHHCELEKIVNIIRNSYDGLHYANGHVRNPILKYVLKLDYMMVLNVAVSTNLWIDLIVNWYHL